MEEKWTAQLSKMNKQTLSHSTAQGEPYPFILLFSRRQEFKGRLFSCQGSGEKPCFPLAHQGPQLPFYVWRGHTRLCEVLAGDSTLIWGSRKSSLLKEVTFKLIPNNCSWARKREVLPWGVLLEGREGAEGKWHELTLERLAGTTLNGPRHLELTASLRELRKINKQIIKTARGINEPDPEWGMFYKTSDPVSSRWVAWKWKRKQKEVG